MMISQTTHDTIDEKSVTETCRRRVFVGACDILHTQSRNFIPLSTHPGYTLTEGAISHFRNWILDFRLLFTSSCLVHWRGLLFVRLIRRIPSIHAKFARCGKV